MILATYGALNPKFIYQLQTKCYCYSHYLVIHLHQLWIIQLDMPGIIGSTYLAIDTPMKPLILKNTL